MHMRTDDALTSGAVNDQYRETRQNVQHQTISRCLPQMSTVDALSPFFCFSLCGAFFPRYDEHEHVIRQPVRRDTRIEGKEEISLVTCCSTTFVVYFMCWVKFEKKISLRRRCANSTVELCCDSYTAMTTLGSL